MFYLKGIIKDDKTESFTRKDGTAGQKRTLFIEPNGDIYPQSVDVPLDRKYGKVGERIEIEVNAYPYCFIDKQKRKAFLSVYVPKDPVAVN
ncbi:MAG: hypothetical protein WC564_03535 [Patescibacteria group bacterium]|jgi:hypothetical protein